jgi:hypothetical protein
MVGWLNGYQRLKMARWLKNGWAATAILIIQPYFNHLVIQPFNNS